MMRDAKELGSLVALVVVAACIGVIGTLEHSTNSTSKSHP